MRHALLVAVLIVTTHASVFSGKFIYHIEGGGSVGDLVYQGEYDYPKSNVYFDGADIEDKIQEWYPKEEIPRSARESREYNENLEEILKELAKQNQAVNEDDLANPGEVEIELQKTKELPKENASKMSGTEQTVSQPDVSEQQPLVAQKKGQNEFVSFVEPVDSKQTKSVATLEKRRLAGTSDFTNALPTYSSNLLMIAVGTVLIVGMVASVLGGGYYIKFVLCTIALFRMRFFPAYAETMSPDV
ncbi:unnamed protein product [Strongylus vulgaris]|uniref:Uncharacterized protein n=1 Tax=Strongylus vulgaris TaxID=40348 RepID=A0A3P7L5X9_STRVU|nr:unnamed protein product [Strongylus vulgaris]